MSSEYCAFPLTYMVNIDGDKKELHMETRDREVQDVSRNIFFETKMSLVIYYV